MLIYSNLIQNYIFELEPKIKEYINYDNVQIFENAALINLLQDIFVGKKDKLKQILKDKNQNVITQMSYLLKNDECNINGVKKYMKKGIEEYIKYIENKIETTGIDTKNYKDTLIFQVILNEDSFFKDDDTPVINDNKFKKYIRDTCELNIDQLYKKLGEEDKLKRSSNYIYCIDAIFDYSPFESKSSNNFKIYKSITNIIDAAFARDQRLFELGNYNNYKIHNEININENNMILDNLNILNDTDNSQIARYVYNCKNYKRKRSSSGSEQNKQRKGGNNEERLNIFKHFLIYIIKLSLMKKLKNKQFKEQIMSVSRINMEGFISFPRKTKINKFTKKSALKERLVKSAPSRIENRKKSEKNGKDEINMKISPNKEKENSKKWERRNKYENLSK